MEHDGHRERLRERYQKEGFSGFAPHEVLELLLTYAIPRVNTNPVAHRLLQRFGTFSAVLEAPRSELEKVDGMGPKSALMLSMMLPLLRMYEQERALPRRRMNTYAEIAAYCRTLFLGISHEQFYLLCFDANLNLLATELMADGTPDSVAAAPRQIVQALMRHNAVGAVLTHNHPSGSLMPSQEDVDLTVQLQGLLRAMDIRLYDHILIAQGVDYSFSKHHWLEEEWGAWDTPVLTIAADRPQQMMPTRKKG